MTTVERMARAIARSMFDNLGDTNAAARAALTALREPDEGMIEAGCAAEPDAKVINGRPLQDTTVDWVLAEWQAMIDKALEE